MRHSPLDGPDGRGRERPISATQTKTAESKGILSRLRGVIERVATAVRRRHTDRGSEPEPQFSRNHTVEQTAAPAVARDKRAKPVVQDRCGTGLVPTDDRGPRERPELVARWEEGRLTLSEPEAAGAQITSDVWAEVES